MRGRQGQPSPRLRLGRRAKRVKARGGGAPAHQKKDDGARQLHPDIRVARPGVAYKLGELQIRHRREAKEKLGAKFDQAAHQERQEPQRHRARLISGRLGVDSRHQDFVVSTVYTMARTPDLLPGTLDLLILRTLQNDALQGWDVSERIQQISHDVLQINQGSLTPSAA